MAEIKNVTLDSVRINGGTQSRVELNQSTISEYAESIRLGSNFPPVVVFFDGSNFWLGDGFHRYHAHRQAGAMEIAAEIRTGTQRDAVLHSVGANASHGLRRTNEDKRRAVQTLLNDPEWATWTDREVAKACGVSHTFVATIRSPEVAQQRQENREKSIANRLHRVEPGSTPLAESDSMPLVSQASGAVASAPSAARAPAAPPQVTPAAVEDDDAPDLAAELVAADKEIRRLTQLLDTFTTTDDLAKQAAEWSLKFDQLSGRNAQLMRTSNEAQSQARYQGDLLAKVRKVLGVTANAEILPALMARRAA